MELTKIEALALYKTLNARQPLTEAENCALISLQAELSAKFND